MTTDRPPEDDADRGSLGDAALLPRSLTPTLQRVAGPYPVVYLTGPRQSGKTTLARTAFPDFVYVNAEDLQNQASIQEDPHGFLRQMEGEKGVIVDEAQRVPELFSYLQQVVDERRAGPFVLTGSQQFLLAERISQSLAGRAAVLQLLPLSIAELARRPALSPDSWVDAAAITEASRPSAASRDPVGRTLDDVLFGGMYPAIHRWGLDPSGWLDSYVATYIERDARLVGSVRDLASFKRFVALCAGRSGQLLNLTSLGADAGVSRVTAGHWLSILTASYIVVLLQPHFENFSRRLVKTPKLFFLDTGLMCALLGLRTSRDLLVHPLRGAVFESFVVSELHKLFLHNGERPPLYFWRDSNGVEVDVLIDLGVRRVPVEAKGGQTVAGDAFNGLETYVRLSAEAAQRSAKDGMPGITVGGGVLTYGGDQWFQRRGFDVRPWWALT
jgi:hypothetical protein